MNKFETNFGEWVVKYRWWIIITTILIVVSAASGAQFLTINNDTRVFFSEKNPQLQALETLENTYTKEQGVLFVIAPKDGNVFTRKTLAAVEELTETAWKMPYSSRVNSITNFQYTRAEEDDLIVEDLVLNAMSLSDADLERIRKIAVSEPLLLNRQISPSGHVTRVYVNTLLPGKSLDEVPQVAAFARKMVDDLRLKYPGIDIHLTGSVMFDNAFGEASLNDLTTLLPLMFITLVIITGLSLRTVAGTFATVIIILISMITGMGLAGWLGISITAASIHAPTIILTLAIADSVHILVTIFHKMHEGKTKHEAIVESIRVNLHPVFFTSVTTVIGFLTMNFSDAPPFRDLGNIVAMGIAAAFVYSVAFLPAMMAIFPVRIKPRAQPNFSYKCCSCNSLADFVINRRKPIFWGTLAVIVILAIGITRIELNDNFVKYFSEDYEIRRATDFMEENLTGVDIVEYSLKSGRARGN